MAKLETIFSAVTWGLMNALLIAVALDSAAPVDRAQSPPVAQLAAAATAPVA